MRIKRKTQKDKETAARSRRSSTEVNELRKKMIEIKERLPKGAVTKFISLYPEFGTYKKSGRVRLVFNLSIVDKDIIEKFKSLADIYQDEVKKGNILSK